MKKVKEVQESTSTKNGTVVEACSCNHAFQDRQYGFGKRLKNKMVSGKSRCTVCSKVSG